MLNYLYYDLDDNDNFIIDYFTASEFASRDGSKLITLDNRLICILYAIRCHFGKPLKIISAFRTRNYNEKIGGAKNSAHIRGMACDFKIDVNLFDLLDFIIKNTNCRIGIYDNFIHIDTYPYYGTYDRIFWINRNGKTDYYNDVFNFLKNLESR